MGEDEANLISEKRIEGHTLCPVALYFFTKIIPILGFFVFACQQQSKIVSLIIILILSISELWINKNINGPQLVGLSWTFKNFKIDYYSKPAPFVPIAFDSNLFWIGFFTCIISWSVISIVLLFLSRYIDACLGIIIAAFEVFGLVMFSKAHNMSKAKSETEVLSILQDEAFELVEEEEDCVIDNEKQNSNSDIEIQKPAGSSDE